MPDFAETTFPARKEPINAYKYYYHIMYSVVKPPSMCSGGVVSKKRLPGLKNETIWIREGKE